MSRRISTWVRRALGAALCLWLVAPVQSVPDRDAMVDFSFDGVDVRMFVKLVGPDTGRRFVVADGVEGKVTVVSAPIRRADVYPLFLSILESVGCSVVERDGTYLVVALGEGRTLLAPVIPPDQELPADGLVTRVLHLESATASQVKRLLDTAAGNIGKASSIGAIDETNHLLVTDTAANVRRIEAVIAEIDQPGIGRETDVIRLAFAGADELAEQIMVALDQSVGRGAKLRNRLSGGGSAAVLSSRGSVIAVSRANSLIAVGTPSQVRAIKELVAKMDIDVPSGHGRLNAIFLRYIEAEAAAENIGKLLSKRAEKAKGGGAISIQADIGSNAILVDATPGDFEVVSRLIEQLDQPPEQVHIDVKILEVTERDGKDIGVSFASMEQPTSVGDSVVQGAVALTDSAGLLSAVQSGIFPNGISFGVSTGTRLDADGNLVSSYPGIVNINALISTGKLKVLSETSLQAENNQEATVRIVDDIPILTSIIEGGSGASRDVIQNIERTDVGIKLTITPHVIAQTRAVRMILAPSIEAIIDAGSTETPFTPTIAKREVSTTVTVDDGRSAVIAGLTRHDSREQVERVPILGSIPLLGVLFRRTRVDGDRTDLLIMVTPHIVTEHAAADATKARWERMTGLAEEDVEHATIRDPDESR